MKPGVFTTEFWLTVANTIFMVVVGFGAMSQASADTWQGLMAPLIGAVVPIVAYIYSRTKVKTAGN